MAMLLRELFAFAWLVGWMWTTFRTMKVLGWSVMHPAKKGMLLPCVAVFCFVLWWIVMPIHLIAGKPASS